LHYNNKGIINESEMWNMKKYGCHAFP
jgi:hypothetical protein